MYWCLLGILRACYFPPHLTAREFIKNEGMKGGKKEDNHDKCEGEIVCQSCKNHWYVFQALNSSHWKPIWSEIVSSYPKEMGMKSKFIIFDFDYEEANG